MKNQAELGERFAQLHRGDGAFLLPNPWDVGSARLLAGLGFEALATTSSGCANALGLSDGQVSLADKLEHCAALSAATDLPLNADMEDGHADSAQGVGDTIRAVAEAGAVGASIEDYDGQAIYPFEVAVERVASAVAAARALPFPFTLTARAENQLRGHNDLDDTIARLAAFERAGADVLYAPGLTDLDQVRAVTGAVAKPVNVLASMLVGHTVPELAAAGAKRISVGGALARLAFATVAEAADEMRRDGSFAWWARRPGRGDLDELIERGAGRPN